MVFDAGGGGGLRRRQNDGALFDESSLGTSSMHVYPQTLIVRSKKYIRGMLLYYMTRAHFVRIVLHWIHAARTTSDLEIIPPRLSRRGPRQVVRDKGKAGKYVEDTKTAALVDLHEQRRARTYDELEQIWVDMLDSHANYSTREALVERILEVDWPDGLTYGMLSTLAFEKLRATRITRHLWSAVCLDYSDDAEHMNAMGGNGGPARTKLCETLTPRQIKEGFSREFKVYYSHTIALDVPIETSKMRFVHVPGVEDLPNDWARPFTHFRVAVDITSREGPSHYLHVLHIPHSPWCLVNGWAGPRHESEMSAAMAALAAVFGARRVRTPTSKEAGGSMGELKGKDPVAIHSMLVSEGLVRDRTVVAGRVPGGKGREMRRGDAEDGPLVASERREREDKTGLYEDAARKEEDRSAEPPLTEEEEATRHGGSSVILHPEVRLRRERQQRAIRLQRRREAEELFGRSRKNLDAEDNNNGDLPSLAQVKYELRLPFPDTQGYGHVPESIVRKHPVQLRLNGLHVLAGLRNLVDAGLDRKSETSNSASEFADRGLPSWLYEVRGTEVRVGLPAIDVAADDSGQIDVTESGEMSAFEERE